MTKGGCIRGAEDLREFKYHKVRLRDAETGKVLTDLIMNMQEFFVAPTVRMGREEIRFATPKKPAQEISEKMENQVRNVSYNWN